MTIGHFLLTRLKAALGPVIGTGLIAYFVFHGIEGDRGLLAYWQLRDRIAEVRQLNDDVVAERRMLEHRVSLLRSDSLDPDLLDERLRIMLDLAHPDELVILHPRNEHDPLMPDTPQGVATAPRRIRRPRPRTGLVRRPNGRG